MGKPGLESVIVWWVDFPTRGFGAFGRHMFNNVRPRAKSSRYSTTTVSTQGDKTVQCQFDIFF